MYPNRHYLAQGLYVPGLRSQTLGHVVVHVDCSGSTGPEELSAFCGELNGVLDARPCRATIVYGDTRVQRLQEWSPANGPMVLESCGGGGTSHQHLWDLIAEQDEPPVCVICLTDGYTSWGTDPGVPVLWAITPDGSIHAPFGRVVRLG